MDPDLDPGDQLITDPPDPNLQTAEKCKIQQPVLVLGTFIVLLESIF